MMSDPPVEPSFPPAYIQITSQGQEPEVYHLESSHLTIGRATDNDIVLSDLKVSRYHARIENVNDEWFIQDLNSTRGILINSKRIPVNVPEPWSKEQPVHIGPYTLYLESPVQSSLIPESYVQVASTSDRFILAVSATSLNLIAGGFSEVQIVVLNQGSTAEQLQLAVDGIPDDYYKLSQEEIRVSAGAHEPVSLRLQLPDDQSIPSGAKPFWLTVSSVKDDQEYAVVSGQINVTVGAQFNSAAVPLILENGQPCQVTIYNQGKAPTTFTIFATSPEARMQVYETPRELTLAEGEQRQLNVKIQSIDSPLLGRPKIVPFELIVQSSSGHAECHEGQLTILPLIPAWMAVASLILLLAVGFITIAVSGLMATRLSTRNMSPSPSMKIAVETGQVQPTDANLANISVTPTSTNELISTARSLVAVGTPKIPSPTPDPCAGLPVLTLVEQAPADQATDFPTSPTPQEMARNQFTDNLLQPVQFLDLPFPYNGNNSQFGGTTAQFRQASQRVASGGRISAFFDHQYPLYPAPETGGITSGREPADEPVGNSVLLFDGQPSQSDYYSGHPAYDFVPYKRREPTTPVFAAADGVVVNAVEHEASGALYVKINHQIPNIGNYQTIYWHLHPDFYFRQTQDWIGQPIKAGTRIGTMGTTGWSRGHHLHFEVRFDANRDGHFTLNEAVDPFGFIPSVKFPADPWAVAVNFMDGRGERYQHRPVDSRYLWRHALGQAALLPTSGGGKLSSDGIGGAGGDGEVSQVCAPEDSWPPGSTVYWSWAPDPPPTKNLAGTGHGCILSVTDVEGEPIEEFEAPVLVQLSFDMEELRNVDPNSIGIYWMMPDKNFFVRGESIVDLDQGLVVTYADRPGRCALLGRPVRDLVAPKTIIEVEGETSPEGSWYDEVTVSLRSKDADVGKIEYSLDGGTTWETYNEPFVLEPSGIPEPPPDEAVAGLVRGPGRFLVLASATDRNGNVEEPPEMQLIIIDPSKGPTPTPTPTSTPLPLPTATFTPIPEPTDYTYVIDFYAEDEVINSPGDCTRLHWYTDNVRTVYLDDEGVAGHGVREICPLSNTTYILRVVLSTGDEKEREVAIRIEQDIFSAIPTPVWPVGEEVIPCQDSIQLKWDVANTTGITGYEWELDISIYDFGDYEWTDYARGSTTDTRTTVNIDPNGDPCDHDFRWRVRALDSDGGYSSYAYFTLARSAPRVELLSPLGTEPCNYGSPIRLEWTFEGTFTHNGFEWTLSSWLGSNNWLQLYQDTTMDKFVDIDNLDCGIHYMWTVKVISIEGEYVSEEYGFFDIDNAPAYAAPQPISPVGNIELECGELVQLVWEFDDSIPHSGFSWQLDVCPEPGSGCKSLLSGPATEKFVYPGEGVSCGKHYTWRVRVSGLDGIWSDFSSKAYFSISS